MQTSAENQDENGSSTTSDNEPRREDPIGQTTTDNVTIDIHSESAHFTIDSSNLNLEDTGGNRNYPYPLRIDEIVRPIGDDNKDVSSTDGNKSGDGVYVLPSYEESQREHGRIDGDLPPPYVNEFPEGFSQPGEPPSAPVRRNRQRRTNVSFGNFPTRTRCKHCRRDVTTQLNHVPGTLTFIIMLLIFFIGGFLFCCLIPLCIPGLKDIQHRCPHCNYIIGYYHRLG